MKRIEELDAAIPRITALKPDVLIVTGDHSTPSYAQEPQLASRCRRCWSPTAAAPTAATTFGESDCLRGGLGQFEAKYLMTLALANAGRLGKYGAWRPRSRLSDAQVSANFAHQELIDIPMARNGRRLIVHRIHKDAVLPSLRNK